MKWDSKALSCVCTNVNAVIFTVDDVVSCKVCGTSINSLSNSDSTKSCACPQGLTWEDNKGCVCPSGEVLIPGAKPKCVDCAAEGVFATEASEDGKSCVCVSDALKWFPKIGKCGCPKSTQVPVGDPIICFECKNNTAYTNVPVINGTNCTCKSKTLVWSGETQTCACPDPAN